MLGSEHACGPHHRRDALRSRRPLPADADPKDDQRQIYDHQAVRPRAVPNPSARTRISLRRTTKFVTRRWCGDPEPETGESTQKSAEEGEEIDVQPLAPIEPTVEVALPVAPVTPANPAALDASAFPGEPNPVVQAPPAYDSSGTITNYGDGIIPAEPAPPAENVVELGTVNNHGGMKIIGGEAGPAGIRDMTPEESAAAEQQRAWGQQQLAASKNTLADSQNMLGSGEVAPGYSAGLAY